MNTKFKPSKFSADTINLQLQPFNTTNQSYPLVQRSTQKMIELWHKTVHEFCQELGITIENAHQVQLLQSKPNDTFGASETFIKFNGQIVGTVRTELKSTAFGLKFTISCLKASQLPASAQESSSSFPAEEEATKSPSEKSTPRYTSDEWLIFADVIYDKKPEFKCSQCGSVFESPMCTPVKCPNGHKAKDDENRIIIVHKDIEDFAFPFNH